MRPTYLILLLLMNFCWSAVYSAYKVLGPDLQTGGLVTLRFGLAGVCLALVWPWMPGQAPRGRDLWVTSAMGVMLYALGQRLQVYGNQIGSAGNSSVLMGIEPLVTSIAAALFLREHIGPRRIMGFLLGLVGVLVLNGIWREDFHWAGLSASLIFISSFVCEAAYSVLGRRIIERASIMKMISISILAGTAVNLLIDGGETISAATRLSPSAWLLLIALAVICTAIGYTLWFVVIRECPVNVAALTIFAQAVFGVFIAAVWVGEQIHWGQLFGSITIVAGLIIGLSRQIKSPGEQASRKSGIS